MASKKLAVIGRECVACGTCMRLCPADALSVPRGLRAVVDAARCIGCGKCAQGCPAGVAALIDREGDGNAYNALV